MKKTLFIHIGYHKTGTTSIQNFFWNNRLALQKEGLLYPEIGLSGPTHAKFALSLPGNRDKVVKGIINTSLSTDDSPYEYYKGEKSHELYQALGKVIEKTECSRILLSSECFLEWIDPSEIKNNINQYCRCNVKIIVYIRRQDRWIQSVFNQVVKDPFLRYAGELDELPQVKWLDYLTTLKKWSDQFGINNMIVRKYEQSLTLEHGTVSDLMNVLGMKNKSNYLYPKSNERNIGLTNWQFQIIQLLNKKLIKDELFHLISNLFERENLKLDYDRALEPHMEYEKAIEIYQTFYKDNQEISRIFIDGKNLFNPPVKEEYELLLEFKAEYFTNFLISLLESKNFGFIK